MFLRLAWLSNPFAYVAINTLIAAMPGVARRLELSTMVAGFCGSVWCFARLGAFFVLWRWNGWHYRFRWLLTAYVVMVITFASILMAPNLAVLVLAQIIFGCVAGLIRSERLALPVSLAADGLRGNGHHLCLHPNGAKPGGAGPGANHFRLRSWPDPI